MAIAAEWHPVDPIAMTLRSVSFFGDRHPRVVEAKLEFLADCFLIAPSKPISVTAIGFSVNVTLRDQYVVDPVRHSRRIGFYSEFTPVCSPLQSLCSERSICERLFFPGVELTITRSDPRDRSHFIVDGVINNRSAAGSGPWPDTDEKLLNELRADEVEARFQLRFGFLTSLDVLQDFRRGWEALFDRVKIWEEP